jgi:MYXO-CTERM domain-containing protein
VAAAGIHIKAANDVINNTILPGKHGGMVGDAIVVSESLNARGPVDLSQSKIMNNLMSPVGALKLRLGQPTITDYAYFEVSVPGSAQWTPARTAFAEFEQPGWGKRASFTPDALTALHFGVSVQGNFVIQVDNLRLLPDASLIDDLEDGNATAPSGGRWSANAGAGSSIVFSVEGPGASSSYAATARGSHVPGGWLQLVHALSSTGGAVDLSSHSGLSFDYRVTFDPTFGTPPTLATARANADCPLDEHFVPTTSCAVDSGEAVPGITDGYFGAAPDIGAFERGAEHWTAGSTLAPRDDGSTGDVPSGDAEQPGTVKELPAACGCRVGQRSTQGSWVFALAALLAGLALRRRAQRTLGHEGRVFPPHL